MKTLIWHCAYFKMGKVLNSTRMSKIDNNNNLINEANVIVPWVTVESSEDVNFFSEFYDEMYFLKGRYKTNKIVLLPFAHLSSQICKKEIAFDILNKLKYYLETKNLIVTMAHFGSYKDIEFCSKADIHQVKFRAFPAPNNFKDNYHNNKHITNTST